MPANSAFLQGWLEPLIGHWLYADSSLWTVVGFMGAAIFGSRFVLQWLQTEKEKKLVVPWHFWHLSFWGSLLNLLYFMHLDKAPLILGNCFLPFLYGRNILFLRKGGEKGQGRKVFAAVAVLVLGGFAWSALSPGNFAMGHSKEERTPMQMRTGIVAIKGFIADFGKSPEGDARAVIKQLRGENPTAVIYLDVPAESLSKEGDWLDLWGHPYRIYISGDAILIRSAGKNGVFDKLDAAGDDLVDEAELVP